MLLSNLCEIVPGLYISAATAAQEFKIRWSSEVVHVFIEELLYIGGHIHGGGGGVKIRDMQWWYQAQFFLKCIQFFGKKNKTEISPLKKEQFE